MQLLLNLTKYLPLNFLDSQCVLLISSFVMLRYHFHGFSNIMPQRVKPQKTFQSSSHTNGTCHSVGCSLMYRARVFPLEDTSAWKAQSCSVFWSIILSKMIFLTKCYRYFLFSEENGINAMSSVLREADICRTGTVKKVVNGMTRKT